jgi:DNA replication protein DnaC
MTNLTLVDAKEKQEMCRDHGAFTSTATPFKNSGIYWSSCPACEAEREVMRREREAADAKREFDERLRCSNIPLRFSGKTLAGYDAKTTDQKSALSIACRYAASFDEHYAAGRCLIFCGRVGCGKTHLACSILREIIAKPFADTATWSTAASHSVKYVTASEFIREIRSTWGKRERSEQDAYSRYAKPHLLVMDEIGLQFGSESERLQIGELIDQRYRSMLPTIVVSNLSKSELPTFLGARGYDRLRENGGLMVVCDWASHRGEQ